MNAMTNMTGIIGAARSTPPVVSENTGTRDLKLRQACADFESIFVNYVLQSARKAVARQGLFHDTHEAKVYESMMDEQMARAVSRRRGLGLGQLLYEQLKRDGKP
jgi:flagellar protein FlgJ